MTPLQQWFVLMGEGSNGVSTFRETVQRVFDEQED